VFALLVGLVWFRPGAPGPSLPWRPLLAAIGWLLAAWGASFALANIAPVIVTALLPVGSLIAGVFAFCFVVARVPVFVLLSLQAILLPALARSAATRDLTGLRHGIRRGLLVVGVLGLGALLLTAPLCAWLTGVLFPTAPTVSAWTLTLLAVGTILAMLVQVLQPALIAVAGHRVVAAGWAAGVVCFAAAFTLPLDPIAAATVAQVVAGVATCAVMGFSLLRVLRAAPAIPVKVVA
jgi:O-antigen/teichoic acid export membrane protein